VPVSIIPPGLGIDRRLPLLLLLSLVASAGPAGAGEPCGPARALPAYAHNDYRNDRPCEEALELGYLGVEADVFFSDGALRLAHDRRDVREGFDFEAIYLRPLLSRARRCSRILPDPQPFLVTIEDKAPSVESRLALAMLLERYRELLQSSPEGPIARFILVDNMANPASIPRELRLHAGLQWRVTSRSPAPADDAAVDYLLLSLDYGKEIEWNGSGGPPPAASALIAAVVAAAGRVPGCLVRVHHVPERERIWSWLLDTGVDLIGVTDLPKGAKMLERPMASTAEAD
jgi:hypothetical protein